MNISVKTDPEIAREIGARLRATRKAIGLTIADTSEQSGLSPNTISRAERGENATLLTVIRLLRTYNRLAALDDFIPAPLVSPMSLVRRAKRGTDG